MTNEKTHQSPRHLAKHAPQVPLEVWRVICILIGTLTVAFFCFSILAIILGFVKEELAVRSRVINVETFVLDSNLLALLVARARVVINGKAAAAVFFKDLEVPCSCCGKTEKDGGADIIEMELDRFWKGCSGLGQVASRTWSWACCTAAPTRSPRYQQRSSNMVSRSGGCWDREGEATL